MRLLISFLLMLGVSTTAWSDDCADLARKFSKQPIRLHGENLEAMHACDDEFVDTVDDYYAQNGDVQKVTPTEKVDVDLVTNKNIVQKIDEVGLEALDIQKNQASNTDAVVLEVKASQI